MSIIEEIVAERRRQTEVEGYTTAHDDRHADGAIARAAAAYAIQSGRYPRMREDIPPSCWPWDLVHWKPKGSRRDLIRAAALIVAEIERLDRKAPYRPMIPVELAKQLRDHASRNTDTTLMQDAADTLDKLAGLMTPMADYADEADAMEGRMKAAGNDGWPKSMGTIIDLFRRARALLRGEP